MKILLFILFNSPCLTLKLRSIQMNMYMTSSFDYCMRYLNKTSITGCSSDKSGNRGPLISISSLDELTSIQQSDSIIILIPARKELLEYSIFHSPNVVGILIDGKTMNKTDDHFTEMSVYSIRKNKYAIDFRGNYINKPIFLLTNQTAVEQIKQLNNQQHIHAQMKSYPYGVKNAEICNRRSKSTYFGEAYFKHYSIKCRSPMINIVWSTLNPISIKHTRPPKSIIIFYTKFDFFSVFQPTNAGVQSTGFGVITLLSLSWIFGQIKLSDLLISDKNHKDILLLFLNGENWNSYGIYELNKMILEKRFPYFIGNENNLHPIESEHIDIIINIDQLGIKHDKAYFVYDNIHPFIQTFQKFSPISIILQQISEKFSDFYLLNISTISMLTNAFEDMNPFYNSYRDTLLHIDDYSSIETHVYSLVKTICTYLNLLICINDLSIEIKQGLTNQIDSLFNCFFQSNCSNLTEKFYFKEVSNNMKEQFTFLQPFLHQSDVKKYINNHFLDASSYIHDILLNWISTRTIGITKNDCEEIEEDLYRYKFYQQSTETCLRVSLDTINLIRDTNEPIDDRIIFLSNSDEPELLIYMINNIKRDIILLICGITHLLCGFVLIYFVKKLIPIV